MHPIRVESVRNLLVHVSRQLHDHGWALVSTTYQSWPYHFTIGLEARFRHPELEALGLSDELARAFLGELVARIRAGERFRSGDFFSDLVPGYDLFLVNNPEVPDGPPVTGRRLRLVWPDADHRYPWQATCTPECAAQRLVPPPDGLDMDGLQVLLAHTRTDA